MLKRMESVLDVDRVGNSMHRHKCVNASKTKHIFGIMLLAFNVPILNILTSRIWNVNIAKTTRLIILILNFVRAALLAIHFSMDLTVMFVLGKPIGIQLQKNVKIASKEQYSIKFKINASVRMKVHLKLMIAYALNAPLQNISTSNWKNAKIVKKANNLTQQLNYVYVLLQNLSKVMNPA
jgi:hypothetical protein